MPEEKITLDVLLKSDSTAPASTATIDALRPSQDRMARCLRWFNDKGIEAHDAGFSITLIGTPTDFARLFNVDVEERKDSALPYAFASEPQLPAEIAEDIEAVTVSVKPDFF